MSVSMLARRQPCWSQALDSLVCPSSYAHAAQQPLGRSVGYLAWLIVVYALIIAVGIQIQLVRWVRHDGPAWIHRLPMVVIAAGRVSSPVRQPWTYASPSGRFVMVLDTTGSVTAIDPMYPQGMLLTERQLIVKRGPRSERYNLSGVSSFTFNETIGQRWLQQLVWWGLPLGWLATSLYLGITKPLHILFFSVWTMLWSLILGRGWRYRALWTMGIYALTGPMLLNLLIAWFAPTLPLVVGGALVTAAYFIYLTVAVAQPNPLAPPSQEADA